MKKLNKKGVSLAELLAVVVIMGIIAAIAIPLVGNVIETSKKKAYLGDLTTVVEAARTYCIAEGKDTGFCKNIEGTLTPLTTNEGNGSAAVAVANSETKVRDGSLYIGASDSLKIVQNSAAVGTTLNKYMSKTAASINTTDSNLKLVQINNKFYITAPDGNGSFKSVVVGASSGYFDPTDPNALINIDKA